MRKNTELLDIVNKFTAFVGRREAMFIKAMLKEGYTTPQISELIGRKLTRVQLDKLVKRYGGNETSE